MDPAVRDRLHQLLSGRESKADKTLRKTWERFARMERLGFSFTAFLSGPEAAQAEGDRFLTQIRERKTRELAEAAASGRFVHPKRRGTGAGNYIRNLKALARLQRYRIARRPEEDGIYWKIPRKSESQKDVYTLTELRALIRLPYRRSRLRRLQRALVMAHLALGWRIGELAKLEDHDVDAATFTVFLRYPEKGNPQRRLPIEQEFFHRTRAFMAWMHHRPMAPENPNAVWTYVARNGKVRVCSEAFLAKLLREAGKEVGVRANCNRGRHTRCAALLAQLYAKKTIVPEAQQLAFVKMFMGHAGIEVLTSYIEMIAAGLLKHLAKTTWFVSAQVRKATANPQRPVPTRIRNRSSCHPPGRTWETYKRHSWPPDVGARADRAVHCRRCGAPKFVASEDAGAMTVHKSPVILNGPGRGD